MIRSLKTVRTMASVYAQSCPIIPGKPGPVEPFSPRCFGECPEVWETVARYFERAFRWDMGGQDGRKFSPAEIEDSAALAVWVLWTITPEQWQRMGVGYGDRMRALHIVRGRLRKMHWRDRTTASGTRQQTRRYRSYKASMSLTAPSPAAVAVAVETATVNGVRGRRPGAGRPGMETRIVSAQTARVAIMGEPMREAIVGPLCVNGGVAHVETDGRMREVEIARVAFTIHTGKMVAGKWNPDGGKEPMVDIETAYRMVSSTSRVDYPRTFVGKAVDVGTEQTRYRPGGTATPCAVDGIVTRRPMGEPEYAADVERYRERLADHYDTDRPLVAGDPRRVRIVTRWKLRAMMNASR